MIVYRIDLPQEQDPAAFVTFMRDEYLPAVRKGPTRVGQVLGLTLQQDGSSSEPVGHSFLLLVEWSGLTGNYTYLRVEDEGVEGRFGAFGAPLHLLGAYREVARWPGEEGGADAVG